mmetsp:Transcript_4887/g.12112  ORF Transcript_4887/g.12112 Transcript_4887/m.12112 type:complete len:268 (+) Transcript_4887:1727-2530(+)
MKHKTGFWQEERCDVENRHHEPALRRRRLGLLALLLLQTRGRRSSDDAATDAAGQVFLPALPVGWTFFLSDFVFVHSTDVLFVRPANEEDNRWRCARAGGRLQRISNGNVSFIPVHSRAVFTSIDLLLFERGQVERDERRLAAHATCGKDFAVHDAVGLNCLRALLGDAALPRLLPEDAGLPVVLRAVVRFQLLHILDDVIGGQSPRLVVHLAQRGRTLVHLYCFVVDHVDAGSYFPRFSEEFLACLQAQFSVVRNALQGCFGQCRL